MDLIVFTFGHSDIRVSGTLPEPPEVPDRLVPGRSQIDARTWGEALSAEVGRSGLDAVVDAVRLPKLEPILREIASGAVDGLSVGIVIVATDQSATDSGFEHTDTIALAPFLEAILSGIAARNGLTVDVCSTVVVRGNPVDPIVCWNAAAKVVDEAVAGDRWNAVHLCTNGGTPALATTVTLRFAMAGLDERDTRLVSWALRGDHAHRDEMTALFDTVIDSRHIRALAGAHRFGDIVGVLEGGSGGARVARVATLARYGDALTRLDVDSAVDHAPVGVRERLTALTMPRDPASSERLGSVTGDLSGLLGLVLEVMEVRWRGGERDAALSLAHLVGEYGGHLAWTPVLGHALDPVRLRNHVDAEDSSYGLDVPGCWIARGGRATPWAREVRAGTFGDRTGYPGAMADWYARIGSDFLVCGLRRSSDLPDWPITPFWCSRPCGVWSRVDPLERPSLAGRVLAAAHFRTSPLMQMRHHSPYAHFFASVDREAVGEAAARTLEGISAVLAGATGSVAEDQPDQWRRLTGDIDPRDLPAVVQAVVRFVGGNVAFHATGFIADARRRLVDALGRAAGGDPRA